MVKGKTDATREAVRADLARVLAGEAVDWRRRRIDAADLTAALRSATSGRGAITLLGADIAGDVTLDGIGESGEPLRLQLLGCQLSGVFRARSSRWRELMIAKCAFGEIDLPGARVVGHLVIDATKCAGFLELRSAEIGGHLTMHDCHFARGSRAFAVTLRDSRIGRGLDARGLVAKGGVDARAVQIGGDLRLDGATLDARDTSEPKALDLADSRIHGRVALCQGEKRFEAHGRVHLDGAEIASLDLKAARLDGIDQPALVADQLVVRGSIDISGLTARGGSPFEAVGTLRLGSARIGRQLQLHDAHLQADEDVVQMIGARIDGDLLIGNPGTVTRFDGKFYADNLSVAGRVIMHAVATTDASAVVSMRQCRVEGEVAIYQSDFSAPILLDSLRADGLSLDQVTLAQPVPQLDLSAFPEGYAHPAQYMLDLNFLRLATDLNLGAISISGGGIRMFGAQIAGGVQLSCVTIRNVTGTALIAQGVRIGLGFHVAGTPQVPAVFDGIVQLMGAEIAGAVSLIHVQIGTATDPAQLILDQTQIKSGVSLIHCVVNGRVNAGGAQIGGDFHFHASRLTWPGEVVCDLRGVVVTGKLQWASLGLSDDIQCHIDGQVVADSGEAAVLSWKRVGLADNSLLAFTNMRIGRALEIERLEAGEACQIHLAGTQVPLLIDRLDDDTDSWGAGRIGLGLNNFSYGRLQHPSGRDSDAPKDIVSWRRKWLARRYDTRSARPARHLAGVLRDQGLFEASRRTLQDAFAGEGRARPTFFGRYIADLFGWFFGHGLSGSRAFMTLLVFWLYGAYLVTDLQNRDYLVVEGQAGKAPVACKKQIDPLVYAADAMIPLLDLGEEKKCGIGMGPSARSTPGIQIGARQLGGDVAWARFGWALYCLFGWVFVSLAIATWSGLFRRGGRE